MKPFLGIDITENKKNEKANGEEFIIQKPSKAQSEAMEKEMDKAVKMINKTVVKSPIIWGGMASYLIGFICLVIFTRITENKPFKEAYFEISWLVWVSAIFFVVGIYLVGAWKRSCKRNFEGDEFQNSTSNIEMITNNILAEFGVPSNSPVVDILSFRYSIQDGNLKLKSSLADYDIFPCNIYRDSENLYIVNCDGKYAFPISSIKGIKMIDEKISVKGWSKDNAPNEEIYKDYKMKYDSNHNVRMNGYHIMELQINGEEWGIYFPCYELSLFESVIGK